MIPPHELDEKEIKNVALNFLDGISNNGVTKAYTSDYSLNIKSKYYYTQ